MEQKPASVLKEIMEATEVAPIEELSTLVEEAIAEKFDDDGL